MNEISFDPFAGGEILRICTTTAPQQEIITSSQLSNEANTAFNEAVSLTVIGSLDIKLLESCINALVERHDILRATFSTFGNEIYLQEIKHVDIDYEDLRNCDDNIKQQAIDELFHKIAISPMDLTEGPLFFVWVKQLEDSRFELIISAHHIICDGWSFGLLLNELADIYHSGGDSTPLPEAPSFFDYADQHSASQMANVDVDYWLERFNKLPPVLDLPLSQPRPPLRSFAAARFDYSLDQALVKTLLKSASSLKSSLVNYVLAGYFVLLYRLSANEDIVVGLPVAGQSALNQPNLLGHMVQLLPIRISLDGNTSFTELVGAVRKEVLNASEHPSFTFGQLLENVSVDRSRVPLVSTIFNIDQAMPPLDFGSALATVRSVPRSAENFEMFLNIVPSSDNLIIEVTYSSVLFSEETVVSWLQTLENVLRAVGENYNVQLDEISLIRNLPDIVHDTNNTNKSSQFSDLVSAFNYHKEKYSDVQAVICGEKSLTYSKLDLLSSQLANLLYKAGVREGSVVGICCARSERLLIYTLATLKLGAAYLPLDPDFPQDRLVYMLEDSNAIAVIEDSSAPQSVREVSLTHISADDLKENLSDEISYASLPVNANSLAYIIYTSGSTGKPKGVKVQNSAMINFLESMRDKPAFTDQDSLLAVTTLSFDISVLELFLPLICGGTTVVASRDDIKDGERLAMLIEQHNITVMQATPGTWRLLLASQWCNSHSSQKPKLKALCGGEPLPPDLVKKLLPHVKELWNMFGPTETTVWSTCKKIQDSDSLITIGKPIANTQVYILDTKLNPLPISIPGELCIAGAGVTLGYHNRPELNAEQFVDHPKFGRLYRTGDFAMALPNGEIQHLGRIDDQVKLRGYRIELGEIELAIKNCAEVEQAAVYMWEINEQDVRVVACCVPVSGNTLEISKLRKQLRKVLPGYMIPQYFLSLDSIPLTPSGKIDRRALPRPDVNESSSLGKSELQSDSEELIAQIWSNLLKSTSSIGRDDNFFEIGGHSLLGTQLIAKINSEFSANLSLKDLFIAPTIGQQATLIKENLSADSESIPAIKHDEKWQGHPPATSQQQRLWYMEQIEPDSKAYNLAASFRLIGKLDVAILQRALEIIVERHEVLRTNLTFSNGHLEQVIRPYISLDLRPKMLPDKVDANTGSLNQFLKQESALSFDLKEDVLFQPQLFRVNEEQHVFFLLIHHLIFDGWSFDVILNELCILYNSLRKGEDNCLPELPVQYSDYAIWQQEYLNTEQIKKQLDYWLNKLSGELPILALPEDHPRPAEQAHRSNVVLISLTEQEIISIEETCKALGCTLFMMFVSVYSLMLYRFSRQQDIIIGAPVSGRGQDEISGLLGFFVNTVAFRFNVQPDVTFKQWLGHVKQVCVEVYANQDLPFDKLVRELAPKRDQSRSPIFQSFFLFQDTRNRTDEFDSLEKEQITVDRAGVQTDLDFWMKRERQGLVGGLEYPIELFEHSTVEMFTNSFLQLLGSVVDNPNVLIENLTTASKQEIESINHWNDTAEDFGHELFLHRFQRSAQANRAKIAVSCDGLTLTYNELDERSNQLANFLSQEGAARDSLIGICMNRGVNMLISLLAVWKTGAAYVPLDPEFPDTRLQYMLDTSAIKLMITESSLTDVVRAYDCRRVCLDSEWTAIENMPTSRLDVDNEVNDIAYVIFTSGSTGKPKGVQVTHGAVTNFLMTMAHKPGLDSTDCLLAVTSLSFDIAVLELYLPLIMGANVVITKSGESGDGNKLMDLINHHGITVMQSTPSTWRILLASGWQGDSKFKVLCGGEAFPIDLARQLLNLVGEVWNMYGPTETTVWSTCCLLKLPLDKILIGQPIANTQCYILDAEHKPLPIGAAGELYIGGDGVAAGYLGREDLTRERFISDPFSDKPGVRLYQTGDLACWRQEGLLEYHQRMDDQVKLRGYRIELGEIETVLLSHPAIMASVVIVQSFDAIDQRLVAYITFAKDQQLSNNEIRLFLRGALPDYMIPQLFVTLKNMPLTPNGKLDRKRLPTAELTLEKETDGDKPKNDFELSLLVVWRRLLKNPSLTIDDNFFDSGGHSLLALSAIDAMESATGIKIDIGLLFQNPTIESLVASLDSNVEQQSTNVVLLKDCDLPKEQQKEPIFLLSGVEIYQNLANVIEDRVVYGVFVFSELAIVKDALSGTIGKVSFESLYNSYIEAIRRTYPEGPYLLGGISFGGFIAINVATKLQEQGAEVQQVLLLDTNLPSAYKRLIGKYLLHQLKSILHSPRLTLKRLKSKVTKIVPTTVTDEHQKAVLLRDQAFINIMKNNEFIMAPYQGVVILFKAEDRQVPDWWVEEDTLGWGKIVNALRIIDTPGDHLKILSTQNASHIAEVLNELD